MKKTLIALSMILVLTACGGSDSKVSKENRGFYILQTQRAELVTMGFNGDSTREACSNFRSENDFFGYELSGMNVQASGLVTGIVGVRDQILEGEGEDALIGRISGDNSFEFSDLVTSQADIPYGMELEVVFDEFNKSLVIKPKGFEIPREFGEGNFPYFVQVSRREFEDLNDKLTIYCR